LSGEVALHRFAVLKELWLYMKRHRAWWLSPIIVVLLLVAVLVILGGTGAAPFIYTLF
jgi:hypothetical protein